MNRCEVCDYSLARHLVCGMQVCGEHIWAAVETSLTRDPYVSVAELTTPPS